MLWVWPENFLKCFLKVAGGEKLQGRSSHCGITGSVVYLQHRFNPQPSTMVKGCYYRSCGLGHNCGSDPILSKGTPHSLGRPKKKKKKKKVTGKLSRSKGRQKMQAPSNNLNCLLWSLFLEGRIIVTACRTQILGRKLQV